MGGVALVELEHMSAICLPFLMQIVLRLVRVPPQGRRTKPARTQKGGDGTQWGSLGQELKKTWVRGGSPDTNGRDLGAKTGECGKIRDAVGKIQFHFSRRSIGRPFAYPLFSLGRGGFLGD